MEKPRRLDARSLKALAHPLRLRLLRALREEPATATALARRTGHNTGTISWHLRRLAHYGFIEDDLERGSRRERWWRATRSSITLDIRDPGLGDDPAALETARWYARATWQEAADALEQWIASADRWPPEWIGASLLRQDALELTAAQLAALQGELSEVIERHRIEPGANPEPGARRVQLALQAFPIGNPDGD